MVGEIPESSLGMMKVKIICAILKKKKNAFIETKNRLVVTRGGRGGQNG